MKATELQLNLRSNLPALRVAYARLREAGLNFYFPYVRLWTRVDDRIVFIDDPQVATGLAFLYRPKPISLDAVLAEISIQLDANWVATDQLTMGLYESLEESVRHFIGDWHATSTVRLDARGYALEYLDANDGYQQALREQD